MMERYCVLYDYDYYDNGGVGWKFFEDSTSALVWIANVIEHNPGDAALSDFQLFEGKGLPLKAVEVATKIMVDEG